ncbi:hypothetical protein L6452_43950 [Arctium lappa]|uniref:Uncharacterized protein n=1 Tax=Arctium lappa TaxID=4217 RepID=A0ACB8XEV0_ARCLA|nr:hypothetical protein L6452_43950 [Arctium lappa]
MRHKLNEGSIYIKVIPGGSLVVADVSSPDDPSIPLLIYSLLKNLGLPKMTRTLLHPYSNQQRNRLIVSETNSIDCFRDDTNTIVHGIDRLFHKRIPSILSEMIRIRYPRLIRPCLLEFIYFPVKRFNLCEIYIFSSILRVNELSMCDRLFHKRIPLILSEMIRTIYHRLIRPCLLEFTYFPVKRFKYCEIYIFSSILRLVSFSFFSTLILTDPSVWW